MNVEQPSIPPNPELLDDEDADLDDGGLDDEEDLQPGDVSGNRNPSDPGSVSDDPDAVPDDLVDRPV